MELPSPTGPRLSETEPEGSGPSTRARFTRAFLDLVILNQLRLRPMHGYELMCQIRSCHGVTIRSGTLYPLLRRLERRGFISGRWQGEARRKKAYTITLKGLRSLRETRKALHRLLEDTA